MKLILSLFTGAGLLDKAFRESGFCVVSAGDIIYGQDIREFKASAGHFDGVIGGSPCQDYSGLKRNKGSYSDEMLKEYIRIVKEASPDWWLLENVAGVPDVSIDGYIRQRVDINQGWYSDISRLRHIQFGRKVYDQNHRFAFQPDMLDIPRGKMKDINYSCALASDSRSFAELLYLQGLPSGYDLPDFTVAGKKKLVGNGVPLVIGRVLAQEVKRVTWQQEKYVTAQEDNSVTHRGLKSVTAQEDNSVTGPGGKAVTFCKCGCSRSLTGRKKYFDGSCRKRAERKRKRVGH